MFKIFFGLQILIVCALSASTVNASDWPDDWGTPVDKNLLTIYHRCQNKDGSRLELYSVTGPGSLEPKPDLKRNSLVTANNWAYLGMADEGLKRFVSNSGEVEVVFTFDHLGNAKSAELIGRGFEKVFDTCKPVAVGG